MRKHLLLVILPLLLSGARASAQDSTEIELLLKPSTGLRFGMSEKEVGRVLKAQGWKRIEPRGTSSDAIILSYVPKESRDQSIVRTFYIFREGGLKIAASSQSFPKTAEGLVRAEERFASSVEGLTRRLGAPTSSIVEEYIASYVTQKREWERVNIMVGQSNSRMIGVGKFYAVVLHEYMTEEPQEK